MCQTKLTVEIKKEQVLQYQKIFISGNKKIFKSTKAESMEEIIDNNNLAIMIIEIESQAIDIHVDNDHKLRYNAINGHLEAVRYLVEKGADVHAKNDEALRLAAKNGHYGVVRHLIKNGANVQANNNEAVEMAAKNGHLKVVKLLIANQADSHFKQSGMLRYAAENGHLDVVQYAVEMGISIYMFNDLAIKNALDNKHKDVVKYLISVDATEKKEYMLHRNAAGKWKLFKCLSEDCDYVQDETTTN
jgi:ankyrin repeat protein